MRVIAAVVLGATIFAAACSATTPIVRTGDRVLASGPGEGALRDRQLAVKENVVYPSPPLVILPVLRSVYDDLGIEVRLYDPSTGEVGNRSFSKMYRLAGMPMSRFVGCGNNAAGSAADNYRITMNIVSRVIAVPDGSRIETSLTATADDIGSSKGQIACESLGQLETRIHDELAKKLKAAQ